MLDSAVCLKLREFQVVYRIPDRLKPYYAWLITALQTLADAFTVALAFWFGYVAYAAVGYKPPQTPAAYSWIVGMAVVVYVFIFRALNLYAREISLLNVDELKKLFIATLWASFVFFGLTFYVRSVSLSRIMITVSILGAMILVYFERLVFYRIHLWLHERGFSQEKVLIYGAGKIGKHLAKRLFQSPALGLLPVGFIDDEEALCRSSVVFRDAGPKTGLQVLGGFNDLARLIREYKIHEVFIALPSATYEKNMSIINICRAQQVKFSMVPPAYAQFIQKIEATEIGGIPILRVKGTTQSLGYLFSKRVLDFVASLVAIALLSPLIIFFGVLIKLDSRGPVIFKQKRVGYKGKEFSFYKFRTMHLEAPKYDYTPRYAKDPRITRVGRWLRRSSLDELPQLFNVLRGEMSLVGPRPEMPFIVANYDELQRERLSVKPGITGVWQISCVRGEPIHENVEYDLYYIEHRSMLLDLVILLKTFLGVVRGIGAV